MRNEPTQPAGARAPDAGRCPAQPPQPTTAFRRRSWLAFQRAIDPLARPKPLRIARH